MSIIPYIYMQIRSLGPCFQPGAAKLVLPPYYHPRGSDRTNIVFKATGSGYRASLRKKAFEHLCLFRVRCCPSFHGRAQGCVATECMHAKGVKVGICIECGRRLGRLHGGDPKESSMHVPLRFQTIRKFVLRPNNSFGYTADSIGA